MIIGYITGSLALIVFAILWVIIQFGTLGVMVVVGFLAIIIAALIGLVIWLISMGRGIFTERKYGAHF